MESLPQLFHLRARLGIDGPEVSNAVRIKRIGEIGVVVVALEALDRLCLDLLLRLLLWALVAERSPPFH